jgi:GH25 family lysozyme M1 (1,4-beta-N-acetylmuramidase)
MVPFIDISHHNPSPISFAAIKDSGIPAVIMKATQGVKNKDKEFPKRILPALDSGLLVGAYHYGTVANVIDQCDNFLEVIEDYNLLRVLDFERTKPDDPNKMLLSQAEDFVQNLFNISGKYPVLYFGEYLKSLASKVSSASPIKQCIPWVAQYGPKITNFPLSIWTNGPVLWQYTDKGKVPGIKGNVDFNYALIDETSFRFLWT